MGSARADKRRPPAWRPSDCVPAGIGLALAALLTGCGFSPRFDEGTIACTTATAQKDCPPGMVCVAAVCRSPQATRDAAADFKVSDAGGSTEAGDAGSAGSDGANDAPVDLATDLSIDLSEGDDVAADVASTDTAPGVDAGAIDAEGGTDGRAGDATTIADGGCPDGCALGDRRCAAGGLQSCVMVGMCPTWSVAAACAGRLTCQGAAPTAKCQCPAKPAGCEMGAGSACVSGVHKTCLVDTDTCVYEAMLETCAASRPCMGAFPNATCTCPAPPAVCGGQAGTSCQTTQTVVACAADGAGCLAAAPAVTCPAGKPCTGTAPSANCSCGTPPAECAGGPGTSCRSDGQLITCGLDAASGCLVATSTVPCAAGLTCQGAAPSASCKCPTPPAVCGGATGTVCQGTAGFVTCARDANGCLISKGTTACPTGKSCTGTAPSAMCSCPPAPAECQAGAGTLCSSSGALIRCDNDPTSGCLTVTSMMSCQAGMQCGGSFPAASCLCPAAPAGCASGVGRMCSGGNVVTCTRPASGCYQATTSSCPATKPCGGVFPSADCTCPTTSCTAVGASCSGNVLVTCAPDAAQCLGANTQTCATGSYCTGAAPSAACTTPTAFGYPTDLGSMSSKSTGYLSGQSVALPYAVTIRRFGLISRQAGTNVALGLYSDVGGNPSALIAKAEFQAVAAGKNEYAAVGAAGGPSPNVAAGTYWIMALYDNATSIAAEATGATSANRRLVAAGYGALPLTLTGMTITAQNMVPATNYYIMVTP